jgi:hypothetical protein
MKTSFIKELKGLIINRLNDYKDTTHYACDLAHTLFEGENVDGSVFYNTYRTKEYIKKHFDLFGDLVEYCKDNFDMTLNPFQEPEKAHVILLLEGAQSLLSKLPVIDENWSLLMLVVEKIEETSPVSIIISCGNCEVYNCETAETMFFVEGVKIEAVYEACVKFVEWYNAQKN